MQLHHALRLPPAELSVVTLVGAGGKTSALFRLADEAVAGGRRVVTTTTTHIFAAQAEQAPARLEVTPDSTGAINWAALEAQLAQHEHCLIWVPPNARATGAGGPTDPSLTGSKRQGLPPRVVDALAARAGDLGISLIAVEGDGSRRRPVKAPAPHEPVIPACTTHLVPVVGLDGLGLPLDAPYVHRPEQVRALLQEDNASTRLTPRMLGRLLVEPYGQGVRSKERGKRTPFSSASRPRGARLAPLLNKADSAPRLAAARLIAQRLAQQNQPALIGAVGPESRTAVRERWGATTAVVLAAGESRR
ncbi:MAG: putative selenium-dependent hydroxylase accessory protein YqeC, partial [Caldilineaceae bacterium SB0665_bin_25]|nr:putative selenium-dependent hydroxylase accessory protein YqeC [Caldilineaceae bacterium SB0665_bin_25]